MRQSPLQEFHTRRGARLEPDRRAIIQVEMVSMVDIVVVVKDGAKVPPNDGFHGIVEDPVAPLEAVVESDEPLAGPKDSVNIEGSALAMESRLFYPRTRAGDDLGLAERADVPEFLKALVELSLEWIQAIELRRLAPSSIPKGRGQPIVMHRHTSEDFEEVVRSGHGHLSLLAPRSIAGCCINSIPHQNRQETRRSSEGWISVIWSGRPDQSRSGGTGTWGRRRPSPSTEHGGRKTLITSFLSIYIRTTNQDMDLTDEDASMGQEGGSSLQLGPPTLEEIRSVLDAQLGIQGWRVEKAKEGWSEKSFIATGDNRRVFG